MMHTHMLKDKAATYIEKSDEKKTEQDIVRVESTKKPIIVSKSICPQYGTYFNFCPNCAYNNTKNDFKFCPDCGTSLEKR